MERPPVPYGCESIESTGTSYEAYIVASEVSTLQHEVGDDAMEDGALVVLALRTALADDLEVLGGLGDGVIEKLEVDATSLFWERS
jgi:hypothetical protein